MRVLVLPVEFGGSLCGTYIDFLEVKGKGYLYCDQIKNKNTKSRKNTMLLPPVPGAAPAPPPGLPCPLVDIFKFRSMSTPSDPISYTPAPNQKKMK